MRQIAYVLAGLVGFSAIAGCVSPTGPETFAAHTEKAYRIEADRMVEQTQLSGSLFASDTKLLGNDAVLEILQAPVPLARDAKIALLNLAPGGLGLRLYASYWRTEEYMDLQHRYVRVLVESLSDAEQVREVVPMPSIMIAENMALPQMREAAVRLQADLLLIYGVRSAIFKKTSLLEKDQIKAYATCELLLFDTRTGVIPFTTMQTEKCVTHRESGDFNWSETQQRAQSAATLQVLEKVGAKVSQFLSQAHAEDGAAPRIVEGEGGSNRK